MTPMTDRPRPADPAAPAAGGTWGQIDPTVQWGAIDPATTWRPTAPSRKDHVDAR